MTFTTSRSVRGRRFARVSETHRHFFNQHIRRAQCFTTKRYTKGEKEHQKASSVGLRPLSLTPRHSRVPSPQPKMMDAYSPHFSLDGLGLDLSAVGRYVWFVLRCLTKRPRSTRTQNRKASFDARGLALSFSPRFHDAAPFHASARSFPRPLPDPKAPPPPSQPKVTPHRKHGFPDPHRPLEVRTSRRPSHVALETSRWKPRDRVCGNRVFV